MRRKLRVEDWSNTNNRDRFIEFLNLEIPSPENGGSQLTLRDARQQQDREYSFAEIVYAIRCMVHENENLNVAEGADYHILIDWKMRAPYFGKVIDGRLVCNGQLIAGRLREVLVTFITGIESFITIKAGFFRMTINLPLGSIRPGQPWQGR